MSRLIPKASSSNLHILCCDLEVLFFFFFFPSAQAPAAEVLFPCSMRLAQLCAALLPSVATGMCLDHVLKLCQLSSDSAEMPVCMGKEG